MKGPYVGSICDGTCQLREFIAEEIDTACVRNASAILLVWTIQIAASALGNLDYWMVILARDLHDEVDDAVRVSIDFLT